jgi:hypothetical protein
LSIVKLKGFSKGMITDEMIEGIKKI